VLDLRLLREEPDVVRAALARRSVGKALDDVLAADAARRELVHRIDDLKHEQNMLSKQIGSASADERQTLIDKASALKADIEALDPKVKEADEHLEMLAATLPNLPHDSVPDGADEDDNVEIRRWGEPREIGNAEDHLDIGQRLGVIDTERAARSSGSRFGFFLGATVHLEFALVRLAIDTLTKKGFIPVVPPVLVRREVMFAAGELPGDEAQYYVTQDGLYLTGTSEQALVAMHMDETIDEERLPLRYLAFSTCFRREAGTYGKDTRGIFRVHQFDKVEMFSYAHPDRSWDEHEFLLSCEEELLQTIGIPYRVMNVCTGDMGKKAAKQYDIDAWFPGQGRYRELTSCSNCTDYQSRRAHIRLKGKKSGLPHTLNGTAFAMRTLAALLENNQQPDGSVDIPAALHPYLPDELTRIAAPD
jgi:seryl-tRNA synthetase